MDEIQRISVDKILFDPENPRLPERIKDKAHDEREVLKWMLDDASIIELMGSIGEHDYFHGEPLLVVKAPKHTGYYYVVEGNRRLAAVKLLLNPELASVRNKAVMAVSKEAQYTPDHLPVLVFKRRDDILDYLGYRHITGVKPWKTLEKARYLQELFEARASTANDVNITFRELAKSIGSRADYVAKLLTSLAVYRKIKDMEFFGIKGINEASIEDTGFSLLTTALGYNNIVRFVGLDDAIYPNLDGIDEDNLKFLTRWLFEKYDGRKTKLGESRNLSELDEIVAAPEALAHFKQGASLFEALLLTKKPAEIFASAILESRNRLQLRHDYIHLVDAPEASYIDVLTDIRKMAQDLRTLVQSRLDELEDK